MSSELAHNTPAGLEMSPAALMSTPSAGTIQLAQWAQELDAAHRIGKALAGTEFVPASFRNKPDAAAAAILAGKSLGLDPMNALANIFVVQGKPALYARTMVALVIAQGHDVIRTEATAESVTVAARRKGSDQWQEFTWTIDRAKKAGYLSNKKYDTDPIAMLTAKAQAEACRTVAPDVLAGVAYTVEEVELEDLGERPAPPKPAGLQRLREQAAANTDVGADDDDWISAIDDCADVIALRRLWQRAKNANAPQEILDTIEAAANAPTEEGA